MKMRLIRKLLTILRGGGGGGIPSEGRDSTYGKNLLLIAKLAA